MVPALPISMCATIISMCVRALIANEHKAGKYVRVCAGTPWEYVRVVSYDIGTKILCATHIQKYDQAL